MLRGGKKVVCGSTSGVLNTWSWGYWNDCSDRFPGGWVGGWVWVLVRGCWWALVGAGGRWRALVGADGWVGACWRSSRRLAADWRRNLSCPSTHPHLPACLHPPAATPAGHPESVTALLRYDEDSILTGSSDGLIRVLSIQPNKMLGVLGEHAGGRVGGWVAGWLGAGCSCRTRLLPPCLPGLCSAAADLSLSRHAAAPPCSQPQAIPSSLPPCPARPFPLLPPDP